MAALLQVIAFLTQLFSKNVSINLKFLKDTHCWLTIATFTLELVVCMSNTFTLNDLELLINYAKLRNNLKVIISYFRNTKVNCLSNFFPIKILKFQGRNY